MTKETLETSTSGQDEVPETRFTFLPKTTKKKKQTKNQWFSRHWTFRQGRTMISERWDTNWGNLIIDPIYSLSEFLGHSTG